MNRSLYGLRFGGLASPFYPPTLRPSKPGYRNRYPAHASVSDGGLNGRWIKERRYGSSFVRDEFLASVE